MADIVGKSKIYSSMEEVITSLYNETHAQYSSGGYSWHPRYDGRHRFCRYYDEDGKIRTIFAIEHAPEGLSQGGVESMEVFADCEVYTFTQTTSALTSCSSSEIIEAITTLQNTVETLETKITELETRLEECCGAGFEPLTFTSTVGNATLSLENYGGNAPVLYYAINDSNEYTLWDYSPITIAKDERIKIYGDNYYTGFSQSETKYSNFVATNLVKCSGNVMFLISQNGDSLTSLDPYDYCFYRLFYNCESIHFENTELPAIELSESCYEQMFYNSGRGLPFEIKLPAKKLAKKCYYQMFEHCGIEACKRLPATTLYEDCYGSMFYGSGLKTAPDILPATDLLPRCYENMFANCVSLKNAPELPATTLEQSCYASMFNTCFELETPPELPATTLAQSCYASMFASCYKLTTAPNLPATTLAKRCYYNMFGQGNTHEGVGCHSLTTMPEISATTLAEECCFNMFLYCTGLTQTTVLRANVLVRDCYTQMFSGCTSLSQVTCLAVAYYNETQHQQFSLPVGLDLATSGWLKGTGGTGPVRVFVKHSNANWGNKNDDYGIPTDWQVVTVSS